MPVIILGGIYGGVFTPTEAAVVAVFYALVVGLLDPPGTAAGRTCCRCCASR